MMYKVGVSLRVMLTEQHWHSMASWGQRERCSEYGVVRQKRCMDAKIYYIKKE